MTIYWYDLAGYVGVFLMLVAFLLLQARTLSGHHWVYQVANCLGALGVLLSQVFGQFNAVAFSIALAWLLIAIYGVAHGIRAWREARSPPVSAPSP